jgi:hypothetical protein
LNTCGRMKRTTAAIRTKGRKRRKLGCIRRH